LGAVLGREFPYELIRAVSAQDDETLQSGLMQLVEAELLYQRGRVPRTRYIFKHALIQDAAYASLLRSKRQPWHARIADVLQAQFPDVVEAEPELLAHHFTEAGRVDGAMTYWLKAGERAMQGSANAEAVSHLRRGLELVEGLPDTPERARKELALQAPLGAALKAIKGDTGEETKAAYTRAYELCRHADQAEQVFHVLYGVWNFLYVGVELHKARELANEGLALAEDQRDAMPHLVAHDWMGVTSVSLGDLPTAKQHLEKALSLYDPAHHRHLVYQCAEDPYYESLSYLALTHWLMGYPDQATERIEAAMAWARELAYDPSIAYTLFFAAMQAEFRGDVEALRTRAEELVALSTRQYMPDWLGFGTPLLGIAMIEQGETERGLEKILEGLRLWGPGPHIYVPTYLSLGARAYQRAGQLDQARRVLDEALEVVHKTDERIWEAELYRLQGELLKNADCGLRIAECTPETCFNQALEVARNQQAKSWELRAATSLARLWQSQDKPQDAYELLAPVYEWFTEGFDTADLKDAKALLAELS
ncbi:MAG: adenylate cyclase, partial [Candidatus Tectomicrobia bacterium]